jgi:hypothetical protein
MSERNLRSEDVASKGLCSYSSFTQWLNQNKTVNDKTFAKFAKGLGVSVDELKRLLESGSLQAVG